ncbi:MAG TPA: hypothetical protein VLU92_04180 [Candidatus Dormibacteraeota bacterium]|nr:hypothetical protein [Candidatus Dormibacteraeota bacterium]
MDRMSHCSPLIGGDLGAATGTLTMTVKSAHQVEHRHVRGVIEAA